MLKHPEQLPAATTDTVRFSKYNIFSGIRDSQNYFILNLLTGNADILSEIEAAKVELLRKGVLGPDDEFFRLMAEKGYLISGEEEKKLYRSKYLDFTDSRETDEIQIFFVTNYTCNFACAYCYQDQYVHQEGQLTKEVTDAFFRYIQSEFAGRKKYITVFGGEPFLSGPVHFSRIEYIINKAAEAGLELSFVTNGYYLEEYLPLLKTGRIREIQVTLDGTDTVHNSRRFLKGGGGTFSKIVRGIDMCLDSGIEVNLRMVADRDNINNLPELAGFAIGKGWTKSGHFKTQIGRNYELHHCQSDPGKLFDRISLYEKIYELVKQYPNIPEFYNPAYSVSKFLSENGELPGPLFDACPACKTEWAFDYTGRIYSCTATVGKPDEVLGTFYPEISKKDDIIEEWQARDVTSINDCRECSLQLACGGGCGSVAKNRTGLVCSPDCRPVKELLELGFSSYIE